MWKIGRTQSGTFMVDDLLVNRDGVRIVTQSEVEAVIFIYISIIQFGFLEVLNLKKFL